MPKGKKKRSNNAGSTIVVRLKQATTGSLTAGTLTVALQPSTFNQIASLADGYEFYRITRLKFRLQRSGTLTGNLAMCYVAGVTDTPPNTFALAGSALDCAIQTTTTTVPSQWVSVPPSRLKTYQAWCKTIVGTPDPSVENWGNLFFGGTGTDSFVYEIVATYEFRVICNTGLTPQERGAKEREAARQRMLAILSPTPSTTPAPAAPKLG